MAGVRFESYFLDNIGRILLSSRDFERASKALTHILSRSNELISIARKHKVQTIVFSNFELLATRNMLNMSDPSFASLFHSFRQEFEIATKHRDLLQQELLSLTKSINETTNLKKSLILLKGFSNARFYPAPYLRWMRDVDFICSNWEDAAVMVDSLTNIGYLPDKLEFAWIKAHKGAPDDIYGQFFLVKECGDDAGRFDIHFSTYSLGYHNYLQIKLEDLATTYELSGYQLTVLTSEGCILLALGHMLSDGYVSIKDINDFVSISLGEKVNWPWLGEHIKLHHLELQAALLAKHVIELYDHPRVTEAGKALLNSITHSNSSIWQTHNRSWTLRSMVNTLYTFRVERERNGVVQAVKESVRCFTFYIRRLTMSVRSRTLYEFVLWWLIPKPNLDRWQISTNTCLLLVPTDKQVMNFGSDDELTRALESLNTQNNIVLHFCKRKSGLFHVKIARQHFIIALNQVFLPSQDLIVPLNHLVTGGKLKAMLMNLYNFTLEPHDNL